MVVGQATSEMMGGWAAALQRLIDRIGWHFERPEPRRRVGRFVAPAC